MKYMKMWLTLIPTVILMSLTKVYQIYIEQTGNSIFGHDNVVASYVTIGLVFIQFVALLIMSFTDRKTAPLYNYKSNKFAGVLCFCSAAVLVADACCYLPSILTNKTYTTTTLLSVIFSCVAAFGLCFLALTHITGKKPQPSVSLIILTVPLWCVVKLFVSLTDNSATSVIMTDVLDLFIYLFLALFFVSATSALSMLNQKNFVKETILFGIPLVSVLVTYDVQVVTNIVMKGYTEGYYIEIIKAVQLSLLAMYAVAFMIEISKNVLNKDQVRIIESEEEILELNEEIRIKKQKDFEKAQAIERKNGNLYITHDSSFQTIDTRDSGYFPRSVSYGKYIEDFPIVTAKEEDNTEVTADEKISNVDKLILEIMSGKNDKDLFPEEEKIENQ